MRIALLGYGKMGKEIEKIALRRNHTIDLIIDIDNIEKLNNQTLNSIDVAIDFSTPSSAFSNIMKCLEAKVPIVSGTTGWLEKYNDVKKYCNTQKTAFFYASNYSLGVNIFFELSRKLANIMNKFPDYNVSIEETHHTQKLDAPSGTAITIAEDILLELNRKTSWKLDCDSQDPLLNVTAIRKDNVPGIHSVNYNSPVDSIEITHSAKSRQGFALGAVMAAEYIFGKSGVFGMKDMLDL